jgi:tetratricopeptide (TPR) repeat protein
MIDVFASHRIFSGEDLTECLELVREAMRLAEETDDTGLCVSLLQRMGWIHEQLGNFDSQLRAAEQGIALAGGDIELGRDVYGYSPLIELVMNRGRSLLNKGRLKEGAAELGRAERMARAAKNKQDIGLTVAGQGFYAWLSGDVRVPLARAQEVVSLGEDIGNRRMTLFFCVELASVYVTACNWNSAEAASKRAFELERELSETHTSPDLRCVLAEVQLGSGRLDQALATALDAVSLSRGRGRRGLECRTLIVLARVLIRKEGRDAVNAIRDALDRVESLVDETDAACFKPFVHEERAALAGLLEDETTRQRELREAHRLYVEMGATGHAERLTRELAAS